MIIQICGTNASGKTTAMRKVLAAAKEVSPMIFVPNNGGKQKLAGYGCTFEGVERTVIIMGPYEGAATGGCDALGGSAEEHYNSVKKLHDNGFHVLCEGIRIMNHTRGIELQKATGCVHAVVLTTPLDEVKRSLEERRAAANNTRELKSMKDIESNVTRARNYALKIYEVGGKMYKVDREGAPDKILEILRAN